MKESKYSKYVVTNFTPNLGDSSHREGQNELSKKHRGVPTHVMWLDSTIIPEASYVEAVWVWPECASEKNVAEPHTHEFDEIVSFFGTNWDDPHDLGGEIEFWLDDEQFIMTESFLMFIPAGLKHCPLIARRVDRPIFHFNTANASQYVDKVS